MMLRVSRTVQPNRSQGVPHDNVPLAGLVETPPEATSTTPSIPAGAPLIWETHTPRTTDPVGAFLRLFKRCYQYLEARVAQIFQMFAAFGLLTSNQHVEARQRNNLMAA